MWLRPDWPAHRNVLALSTTRFGGGSVDNYRGLNLGDHVADEVSIVGYNRTVLTNRLPHGASIQWLNQTHSTDVVTLPFEGGVPNADASFTQHPNHFCCVMTADCLPVLLCNQQGNQVAAIHAGWRGLCNGIIEQTIAKFEGTNQQLLAWLGPAIGPNCFEVGDEVRQAFVAHDPLANTAFIRHGDRYLANIYQLATQRLNALGVTRIYGGEHCTVTDPSRFYSYRRDGVTGRQATLIGLLAG